MTGKVKKAGWDCWYDGCDLTVRTATLVRTRPKGEPGEFMCPTHAHIVKGA